MARAIEQGRGTLDEVDLTGHPGEALARLIASSWQLVNQSRSLLVAAQGVLPPGRIRDVHADPVKRVHGLVERGRDEGVFRSDLPTTWLVGIIHSVMHTAADQINAGQLTAAQAAPFITKTLLAGFTPPGGTVPTRVTRRLDELPPA